MRIKLLRCAFALGLAGWLAGSPAMAQVAAGGTNFYPQTPQVFSPTISITQTQAIQVNGTFAGGASQIFNRAFQDNSTFSGAAGSAYASYDTIVNMTGSAAYNHFYGYEARWIYSGSGSLTAMAGFSSNTPQITGGGSVNALRHFMVVNALITSGSLTEQSGLYVPDLTGATNNYGLNLNVIAGTNKYNIYAPTTAANLLNGVTTFGAGLVFTAVQAAVNLTAATNGIDFNFATNTNIVLQGGGTVAKIASLNDANSTYEPLILNQSVLAVEYNGSTEMLRIDNVGVRTNQATAILHSETTITGGGTGSAPTLTSGPVAGNPTKWLPYDDNGTTRYIPSW